MGKLQSIFLFPIRIYFQTTKKYEAFHFEKVSYMTKDIEFQKNSKDVDFTFEADSAATSLNCTFFGFSPL